MSAIVTPINQQPKALSGFNLFWHHYPKKVGKPLAKAKFEAIVSSGLRTKTLDKDSNTYIEIELHATAEQICAGAERYRASQLKEGSGAFGFKNDGRYLLHPATFLNQGRWEDGESND